MYVDQTDSTLTTNYNMPISMEYNLNIYRQIIPHPSSQAPKTLHPPNNPIQSNPSINHLHIIPYPSHTSFLLVLQVQCSAVQCLFAMLCYALPPKILTNPHALRIHLTNLLLGLPIYLLYFQVDINIYIYIYISATLTVSYILYPSLYLPFFSYSPSFVLYIPSNHKQTYKHTNTQIVEKSRTEIGETYS